MLHRFVDRFFVVFQWLLPQRLAGRLVYRFARQQTPWVKNLAIRAFIRLYGVDLDEIDTPVPDGYPHLNAFFTRSLRAGARPVDGSPGAIVSPADGRLENVGHADGRELLQAKRFRYRIADLLATDDRTAAIYDGGATLTIYLAPHNYHRVHLPLAAHIREMTYVPGRRWAVNQRTVRTVPGLFAANERVVLWCESAAGPYALVLVGALNVASISVPWEGEIAAPPGHDLRRWTYGADQPGLTLETGDLAGQFNLGSTVVLVAGRDLITWDPRIASGMEVRTGERLGLLKQPG